MKQTDSFTSVLLRKEIADRAERFTVTQLRELIITIDSLSKQKNPTSRLLYMMAQAIVKLAETNLIKHTLDAASISPKSKASLFRTAKTTDTTRRKMVDAIMDMEYYTPDSLFQHFFGRSPKEA